MRARDIMSRPVITVTPQAKTRDAANLLATQGFAALPVVDPDDGLVGVVTETDLVRARYRSGADAGGTRTVAEVMSSPAEATGPLADVVEVAIALAEGRIQALVIVDGVRVVGMVTRRDLVRMMARTDAEIAADVRQKLVSLRPADRWRVSVRDGRAWIDDEFEDLADLRVAEHLAATVPGVFVVTSLASRRGGLAGAAEA